MITELTPYYSHANDGRLPTQPRPSDEGASLPPLIGTPTIFRALGLTADPFAPATSPVFAETAPHRAALDTLTDWIASEDPPSFGILTAEPGHGVTTMLTTLSGGSAATPVAYAHVTPGEERLTDTRLLQRIIIALGSEPLGRSGLELANQCRHLLDTARNTGKHPVLLLDGLDLGGSQLDVVQALTHSMDGAHDNAMNVSVLFAGSAMFARRLLRRPAIRSHLRCQTMLARLDRADATTLLAAYIDPVRPQRNDATPLLTDEAIGIIADWAQSEARAILRFAREAMLEAIATGKTVVDSALARQIAREFTHEAQLAKRVSDAARFPTRVQAPLTFAEMPGTREPQSHLVEEHA